MSMCPFMPLRIDSVLSKLARARGGVRPHRGFTVKFTAPGAPHLGHHHLPPTPQLQTSRPRCIPPPSAYLRTPRALVSCRVHFSLPTLTHPAKRRSDGAHTKGREVCRPHDDFPRPFVQTASFPGNYRLKRLPTPQKVAAQELIRKFVSNCTLLCVCRGSCAPDPPAIPTGTNSYCTCCRRSLRPKRRVSSLLVLHIHILDSCVGSLNFLLIIYLDQPIRAPRHHWRAEVV